MSEKIKREPITTSTVIGSQKISANEYRKFFKETLGDDYGKNKYIKGFINAPLNHKWKTLKEILEERNNPIGDKCLEEILAENRFKIISAPDKAFIIAFDKALNEMGYDFGGVIIGNIDLMVIVYGKTGTKTRQRPACIHINDDGSISLKLYLNKVDDHRQYIENAPAHIRKLFTNDKNKCNGCSFKDGKCKYKCTKTYTVGGRVYNKCKFELDDAVIEHIPDYVNLLSVFFSIKI